MMSQQQVELRADQMALYPMQRELNQEEQLRLKGGIILWLMGMAVPILLLFELRYVLAGGYVDPAASPTLGGIGLALLVIGAILTSVAKYSGKPVNRRSALTAYGWSLVSILAGFILIGWHVADHSLSIVSHYGMMAIVTLGTTDFYVLGLLIAVLATRGRVKRLNVQNTWGLSATSYYAWFVVAVWVVMYVVTYFL